MSRALLSSLLCLALLCGLLASGRAGETGLPVLRNFPPRDYQEHNQTWATAQGPDGVMYISNRSCVLRYDGTRWRSLDVPDTSFVRGLAFGPDGRLYVGAVNQLGYFDGDPGRGKFVSLLEKLTPEQRDFRDIWGIALLPDGGIAFSTTRQVMVWRDGKFTVIPRPRRAILATDAIFDVDPAQGLLRLEGDRFVVVAGDEPARRLAPDFVLTEADGSLLIGTRTAGLFRCADGRVTPLPTPVDALLRTEGLRTGRRLADGSLVLALQRDGVLLLDRDLKLLTRVDTTSGLASPLVRWIGTDREGGLWLCHNAGVSRLEWPSAITVFNEFRGLDRNSIPSFLRHEGILYAGTSSSLYYLGEDASGLARFMPVLLEEGPSAGRPLTGLVRDLLSTPYGLVSIGSGGVHLIHGDRIRPVAALEQPGLALAATPRDPGHVYASAQDALRRLKITTGQWQDEGPVPGIDAEIRSIITDADGSLWVSTNGSGFFHVIFEGDPVRARTEAFPSGHGLPAGMSGITYVMTWRGRPLFCTNAGMFSYDATSRRFSLIPEPGPRLAQLDMATQGSDQPGHLWIRTSSKAPDAGPWGGRRIYRVSSPDRWEPLPYLVADLAIDNRIFREEITPTGNVLWIPGSDSLVRVDLERAFGSVQPPPRPLLRGTGVEAGAVLPHARNTVSFDYPAPSFRTLAQLEYQTRLIGFEDTLAGWSATPGRTFTNLPHGDYTFEVRARNSDGLVSEPAILAFTVLPPWWATVWAYTGYGLLAGAFVAGIVRFRSRQLRLANEKLEAIVAARTGELLTSEQQLRVARDGAEAANRAKTAFLANMSHELRTPLNAVLGYAQIILRDPALPPDHRRRTEAIAHGGDHLLQMINEVLDLSKIEADKVELAPRPVSLPRLLAAVSEMFQLRGAQKGIAFGSRQLTPLPATVLADEGRLRQVLVNLLENAVKFTPAGGRVDFEVGRTGDQFHFGVRDTGTGIAADQLQAIFRPFHQAALPSLAQQGAGLGLAISQRLVGLMGGVIRVESSPGHGSHFWFEVALPETAARLSTDPFGLNITGYRGARRHVLVTDDEATNRQVLREMLEPLGFVVSEAADGEAAVAAALATRPDVVLMDIRMPRLDGLGATRQLRANPATATIKVIAVSASVFAADKDEAVAQGCDEFLPKPFREVQLLSALGRVLGLDWIQASPAATPVPAPPTRTDARPDSTELAALAALAEQGDVIALRARLAALRSRAPECTAFIAQLDGLAAEFQMTRLSEILAQARRDSSP